MSLTSFATIEELLERILEEEVEKLEQEDLEFLNRNRAVAVNLLIPTVETQIQLLQEDPFLVDGNRLYWALALLSYFKEGAVFDYLRKLCYVDIEVLDECIGNVFIMDCLSWMLAAVCQGRWEALKEEIEDPELDEFIRSACMEAVAVLVAKGEIPREEALSYFKECFHKILFEGLDDETLATGLVRACRDIWPGECLKEIRELFGIGLVDDSFVEMEDLLDTFEKGHDTCIAELLARAAEYHPLNPLVEECSRKEKLLEGDLEMFSQEIDKVFHSKEAVLDQEGEGAKSLVESLLVEGAISFEPALVPEFELLPKEEQAKIQRLHELIFEAPDVALQEARERIGRFPDNPVLYSHLYIIYCELNWKREAAALLKQMVERFPQNLFALVEYAKYLLRRREPDRVLEIFRGKTSLQELYPERKVFNVVEWHLFSHVMALYFVQVGDCLEAKAYFEILDRIAPESDERQEIEEKLEDLDISARQ